MSFSVRSLDELHELALAHYRGRVPGASLAAGSDIWLRTRAVAAVAFIQQQQALDAVRNILPSTADANFLPEHARDRMGDSRAILPAAKAIGKIAVVGASAPLTIPSGATLTHANGASYRVTTGGVTIDPAIGTKKVGVGSTLERVIVTPNATSILADRLVYIGTSDVVRAVKDVLPEVGTTFAIDFYASLLAPPVAGDDVVGVIGCVLHVEAVVAGKSGNLAPGDVLTLDSPIAGVTSTVTVLEMTGGGDLESTEEQRRRVLAYMQERPGSGNRSDYRSWVRETPGVRIEDCCVFVGWRGVGTIDLVPIGVAGARQTGTVTNGVVTDYLASVASELDDVMVRQLLDDSAVAVTLLLTTGTETRADWTGFYTVTTGSTTTSVHLTAAPVNVPIGARVLVYVADGVTPGLYQRVVIGKGATSLLLDAPLPDPPTTGSKVDPGGPITQAAIDAVLSLFDSLGPGDPASAQRFPESEEAWPWVLRPEHISGDVLSVTGVEGCIVVVPETTTTPSQFARVRLGVLRIIHDAASSLGLLA